MRPITLALVLALLAGCAGPSASLGPCVKWESRRTIDVSASNILSGVGSALSIAVPLAAVGAFLGTALVPASESGPSTKLVCTEHAS